MSKEMHVAGAGAVRRARGVAAPGPAPGEPFELRQHLGKFSRNRVYPYLSVFIRIYPSVPDICGFARGAALLLFQFGTAALIPLVQH